VSAGTGDAGPLVDAHVHLWGIGDSDSGILIDPRYRRSLKFLGSGFLLGMHRRKAGYDEWYLTLLLEALRASPVDRAVVQGMEGVYDADGRLDRARTAIRVPNEYTYRVCRQHPELVPAAAISPARADWESELESAAANGAALMCHTGPERAVRCGGPFSFSPEGLAAVLSEGLTVIASHAGTGTPLEGTAGFDAMVRLMERHEKLYADSSAVVQMFRWRWVRRIGRHQLVRSRLLHGSDYPVPITTLPWGALNPVSWWRIGRIRSAFARDFAVKEAAGYGRESALRSARVLGIRPAADPAP
jgi:predicted TIM-barrel fold metal-dependent hydrolase